MWCLLGFSWFRETVCHGSIHKKLFEKSNKYVINIFKRSEEIFYHNFDWILLFWPTWLPILKKRTQYTLDFFSLNNKSLGISLIKIYKPYETSLFSLIDFSTTKFKVIYFQYTILFRFSFTFLLIHQNILDSRARLIPLTY